jgi:hypothetical protein
MKFSYLAKWQTYARYFLLNLTVLFFLKYSWSIVISFKQFFVLLVVVIVADTVLRVAFSLLPKPLRLDE